MTTAAVDSGVLNIDKPAGMTSHDVVGRVRRALRTRRVGHAGTLDPDATGVLVVAVGAATRLLPYLPTEPKRYVARIHFGVATFTEDASGAVTAEADASALTLADVQSILPRFLGRIDQIPPMVSALHHEGQRLYDLARKGIVVERASRTVAIHSLEISDFVPGTTAAATLHVTCGGGTYVRTLCADIGAVVGLPAHMAVLRREAVGRFRIDDALDLDSLCGDGAGAVGRAALVPMEAALDVPVWNVGDEDALRIARGQSVVCAPPPSGATAAAETVGEPVVALLYLERLIALGHLRGQELFPFRVFGGNTPTAATADTDV